MLAFVFEYDNVRLDQNININYVFRFEIQQRLETG